jgi:hypothetical protein
LRVAVRNVLRRFGDGASSRGDVHIVMVRLDRLRLRIPRPGAEVVGHGRAPLAPLQERCNRW